MASDPLWRKTPLVESRALSESAGCRIFLKLENLQPSGSFKSRGIGNLILNSVLTTPNPHFYSSSGGNAGLACVVAAAQLGHPATVVVPMTTKKMMIDMIERGGARKVIQYGKSWRDADEYLREVIMKNDPSAVYVPPFDHEDIWEGHSTIVDEILTQLRDATAPARKVNGGSQGHIDPVDVFPSAIVCSVGGGGLFCGVMRGLDRIDGAERYVDIVAVETDGAASMHHSLKEKKLVTLPGITSAATSLGCVRVATETFKYAQRQNVHSVSMSDRDAEAGCVNLAETDRLCVELACGVNVSMCRKDYLQQALGREVRPEEKVVIVVCGGSNVTVDMLAAWKADVLKRAADQVTGDGIQVQHGRDF